MFCLSNSVCYYFLSFILHYDVLQCKLLTYVLLYYSILFFIFYDH